MLRGKELRGRPIKVNFATVKKDGPSNVLRFKPAGGGFRTSREPLVRQEPAFDRWNRDDAATHSIDPLLEGRRLFVGGLPRMAPQKAVDCAIQELFKGFEVVAVSKMVSPWHAAGESPGDRFYVFVDLSSKSDADGAIGKLDGKKSPWTEGKLIVRLARKKINMKLAQEQFALSERTPPFVRSSPVSERAQSSSMSSSRAASSLSWRAKPSGASTIPSSE
ncbi:uncharacterized protein EV422DRAFT_545709 [Fimicolochytrium jonesii]|uniref:uncharacterized protein n=1 Tax=Fimicolochytrium jonesii TaxID=1396493 RepID=UPI0022FEC27F|nr:uncharacterized protein EV422DRAFT_545709 [Fimicolochytrium jonesii]KAI8816554.1 hypothetical protein EV422DRAFT_545709 [Fimicolochytrium jonesii]